MPYTVLGIEMAPQLLQRSTKQWGAQVSKQAVIMQWARALLGSQGRGHLALAGGPGSAPGKDF